MFSAIERTYKDRQFLKTALALIFPIAMQSLLMSGVNFLDNIMIGRLGEASIAAVSLANQYYFLLTLVAFGVCSGAGIFISQFHGKGDTVSIRKVMFINVAACTVVSALFMILAIFLPNLIMGVFSTDVEVIKLGANYLIVVAIGYIPTGISMALQIGLKSVGKPRIPLIMTFIALCINGVLNYVFIFGKFGVPAMGVVGAALATILARIIEMILTIIFIRIYSPEMMIKLSDILGIKKEFVKKFSDTASLVVINEFFWGLGTCLYSFVYGRMGTDVAAAVSIATTIEKLLNIFMFGMGNAAVVMIGSKIGEGDIETGKEYASRFSVMACFLGVIMAVAMFAISPFAPIIFNIAPEVRWMTTMVLIDIGIVSAMQCYNHTNFIGSLRSGGDTKFCLIIDIVGVWGISLPLLILSGLVLRWPIQYTYLMLGVEQFVKIILISARLKSGKWISNLVKDM